VPADVAEVFVALAAAEGAVSYDELLARLLASTTPDERLAALGRTLALTLDDRFRAQDFHYVFRTAMGRHDARAQTFQWFMREHDAVRARQPEFTFVHIGLVVGHFRDTAELEAATRFFDAHGLRAGDRAVRQGEERARHCILLADRGRASLHAWLSAQPG
jgi:hypothetical protein